MRQLLLSAAFLSLLAAPALAQPDGQQPERRVPGQGHLEHPPGTPQPAAQPAPQQQAPRGGNGGPTSFTNQPPQGTLPGGGNMNGDRGNRGGDRGNWQGRQGGNNGYNGFNNNRGRGGYNGQRHDFSSFRDYHRDFRSSRRFRGPDYRRPAGWYDHRWTFGEFLPSAFWARNYWLSDYGSYDLPPPPYGATWVRVGNDALLVDQDSGEVITVEYDVFY